MDNTEDNSMSNNSIFGSNWLRKKRYEDEEFSMSPPTDDSSGFFLPFGLQRSKTHESMYDRINKEMGLSVEGPKEQVTTEYNLIKFARTATSEISPGQLLLGSQGIFLDTEKWQDQSGTQVAVVTNPSSDTPKIVLPASVLEDSNSRANANAAPTARKPSTTLTDTFDPSFLENLQNLKVDPPLGQDQPAPSCPVLTTRVHRSLDAATETCNRARKHSAPPSFNPMLMDSSKTRNYFFTGSFFASSVMPTSISVESSVQNLTSRKVAEVAPQHDINTASNPLPPNNQSDRNEQCTLINTISLIEEKTTVMAELEPKPKMGKLRPRASALREMNFLAPQSM